VAQRSVKQPTAPPVSDHHLEMDRALSERRALLDQTLQVARWLLATLFILNGAAAVTTLNMSGLDPAIAVKAAETFVAGLTAAIVAGMCAFLVLFTGLGIADAKVQRWERRKWWPGLHIVMMLVTLLSLLAGFVAVTGSTSSFTEGVRLIAAAKEAAAEAPPPSKLTSSQPPSPGKR
jgi:hypothetical protein